MIGQGIVTKYVVELTAKHVLRISPDRASLLGNVCKWGVAIATLDMGGVAMDFGIDYIVDMLAENVGEAATENVTEKEVGEGGRGGGENVDVDVDVDVDADDTDEILNGRCLMGGLAVDDIVDMLLENVVEAATENGLDVILDNATTEEVGEGGRVDADDDTDKFLNMRNRIEEALQEDDPRRKRTITRKQNSINSRHINGKDLQKLVEDNLRRLNEQTIIDDQVEKNGAKSLWLGALQKIRFKETSMKDQQDYPS